MPCNGGYRNDIQASKVRAAAEKAYLQTPEHKHWMWLVHQVHDTADGFASLSHPNKLFFATNLVSREVYNGGFDQYFVNSSADYFNFAVEGLTSMGAVESLKLLLTAKQLFYGHTDVPTTQTSRWDFSNALDTATKANRDAASDLLDKSFWTDPDKLDERMLQFAQRYDLYKDF